MTGAVQNPRPNHQHPKQGRKPKVENGKRIADFEIQIFSTQRPPRLRGERLSMRGVRKFFRLPRGERWLLVKVALLLGAIRVGLRLLPFQTLKRLLDSVSRASPESHRSNQFPSDHIAWAVITATPFVLGDKTCLTQALAAQLLLKRRGYPASLRIGVGQTTEKELVAHAWVESGDRVVVGGGDLSRYTPLPAFDEKQRQAHVAENT